MAVILDRSGDLHSQAGESELAIEKFKEALEEDLNVSEAMAALFDFVRETNKRMDEGLPVGDLGKTWERVNSVLGLAAVQNEVPREILALLELRKKARADKDWRGSDRIRDEILALGWVVRDTPKGQEVKKL